ncbi:MAG: hypothetical protein KKD11_05565, partial [Candidatus Omnitrophica bacterium]|nr:hypothetical protein [Candidatus Omnitrophota bacterium]
YKVTKLAKENAYFRENFEKFQKLDEDKGFFDMERLGLVTKMLRFALPLWNYTRTQNALKDTGVTIKQFKKLADTFGAKDGKQADLFVRLLPYLGLSVSTDNIPRMREGFEILDADGYDNVKLDKIKQIVEARGQKDRNKILNDEIIKKNKSVDKAITKIMTGLGKEIKVGKEINPNDINRYISDYLLKDNKEFKGIKAKIKKYQEDDKEVPKDLTDRYSEITQKALENNKEECKAIFDFCFMLLGAFGEKDQKRVALKEMQESHMSRHGPTKGIKDYSLGAIMDLYEKYKSWGITMDDIYRSYGISGDALTDLYKKINIYNVELQKYLIANMKKMKQEDMFIIPWLTTINDIENNRLPEISSLVEQIKKTKQMITEYAKEEVKKQGFGRLLDKKNKNKIDIKFGVASITDEKDKANRGNMYCDKDHIGIDARMVAEIMAEMQGVSPEHVKELIKRKIKHEIGHLRDQINAFRIAERDDATNVWRFKEGGLEEVETYMTKTVKALFRIALKRIGKDDTEMRKMVNSVKIRIKEHKKDGKYLYSIKLEGKGLKDSGLNIPEKMLKGTMKLEGVTIIEFLANMRLVSEDVGEFKKNVAYALWYDMRFRLRMMNGDFDNHEQVYNQAKRLMEKMKELGLLGYFMSFGVDYVDYQNMFALDIARRIVDINKSYNEAKSKRADVAVQDAVADRPAKQAEAMIEELVEELPIAARAEDKKSIAEVTKGMLKNLIGEDILGKMTEKDKNYLYILLMHNPQDKEFEDIRMHLETQGFVVSRGADAIAIKLSEPIEGKWRWVKTLDSDTKTANEAAFEWHITLKKDKEKDGLWDVVAEYGTDNGEGYIILQVDAGEDLKSLFSKDGIQHTKAVGKLIDLLANKNIIFSQDKLSQSEILKNIAYDGKTFRVIDVPSLRFAKNKAELDQAVAAAKAKVKQEYDNLLKSDAIISKELLYPAAGKKDVYVYNKLSDLKKRKTIQSLCEKGASTEKDKDFIGYAVVVAPEGTQEDDIDQKIKDAFENKPLIVIAPVYEGKVLQAYREAYSKNLDLTSVKDSYVMGNVFFSPDDLLNLTPEAIDAMNPEQKRFLGLAIKGLGEIGNPDALNGLEKFSSTISTGAENIEKYKELRKVLSRAILRLKAIEVREDVFDLVTIAEDLRKTIEGGDEYAVKALKILNNFGQHPDPEQFMEDYLAGLNLSEETAQRIKSEAKKKGEKLLRLMESSGPNSRKTDKMHKELIKDIIQPKDDVTKQIAILALGYHAYPEAIDKGYLLVDIKSYYEQCYDYSNGDMRIVAQLTLPHLLENKMSEAVTNYFFQLYEPGEFGREFYEKFLDEYDIKKEKLASNEFNFLSTKAILDKYPELKFEPRWNMQWLEMVQEDWKNDISLQGWKIHVGFTEENALEVIEKCMKVFNEYHQIQSDIKMICLTGAAWLERTNNDTAERQRGKNLVIYVPDCYKGVPKEKRERDYTALFARGLALDIDAQLNGLTAPATTWNTKGDKGDRLIGKSGLVGYRYGQFNAGFKGIWDRKTDEIYKENKDVYKPKFIDEDLIIPSKEEVYKVTLNGKKGIVIKYLDTPIRILAGKTEFAVYVRENKYYVAEVKDDRALIKPEKLNAKGVIINDNHAEITLKDNEAVVIRNLNSEIGIDVTYKALKVDEKAMALASGQGLTSGETVEMPERVVFQDQVLLSNNVVAEIALDTGMNPDYVKGVLANREILYEDDAPVLQATFGIRKNNGISELVSKKLQLRKEFDDRLPEILAGSEDSYGRIVDMALLKKELRHIGDGPGYDLVKLAELKELYAASVDVNDTVKMREYGIQLAAFQLHFEAPKYKLLYEELKDKLGGGDVNKAIAILDKMAIDAELSHDEFNRDKYMGVKRFMEIAKVSITRAAISGLSLGGPYIGPIMKMALDNPQFRHTQKLLDRIVAGDKGALDEFYEIVGISGKFEGIKDLTKEAGDIIRPDSKIFMGPVFIQLSDLAQVNSTIDRAVARFKEGMFEEALTDSELGIGGAPLAGMTGDYAQRTIVNRLIDFLDENHVRGAPYGITDYARVFEHLPSIIEEKTKSHLSPFYTKNEVIEIINYSLSKAVVSAGVDYVIDDFTDRLINPNREDSIRGLARIRILRRMSISLFRWFVFRGDQKQMIRGKLDGDAIDMHHCAVQSVVAQSNNLRTIEFQGSIGQLPKKEVTVEGLARDFGQKVVDMVINEDPATLKAFLSNFTRENRELPESFIKDVLKDPKYGYEIDIFGHSIPVDLLHDTILGTPVILQIKGMFNGEIVPHFVLLQLGYKDIDGNKMPVCEVTDRFGTVVVSVDELRDKLYGGMANVLTVQSKVYQELAKDALNEIAGGGGRTHWNNVLPQEDIIYKGIGSVRTVAKGVQPVYPVYDASALPPQEKVDTKKTAGALASGETVKSAQDVAKLFNKKHEGILRIEMSDIVSKQIPPEALTAILLQLTDKAKHGHLYDVVGDLEKDYNVTLPKTKGLTDIVIHIDFDNTPKGQWAVLNRENVISINLAQTGYSSEEVYYNASMEARNWLYEKLVHEIEVPAAIDAEIRAFKTTLIDEFNAEHEGAVTINVPEDMFGKGRDLDYKVITELIANIREENKAEPFTVDKDVIKYPYNFDIEKKQGLTDIKVFLEYDADGKWVTRRENEIVYVNLARIDLSKRSHDNRLDEAIYQARKSLISDLTSRIRKIGEIKGYWKNESIENIAITAKELSEIDAVYEVTAGAVIGEVGEFFKEKDFKEYEAEEQIEEAFEAYDEGESLGEFYSRIDRKLFGADVSKKQKIVYAVLLSIAAVVIGFIVGYIGAHYVIPWLHNIFEALYKVSDKAPIYLAKAFISSIFVALATGIVVFINRHERIRRSPIAKIIYGSMGVFFMFLAPSALKAFSPDGPAGTPLQPQLPQMPTPTFGNGSSDVPAPFANREAYMEHMSNKAEAQKIQPAQKPQELRPQEMSEKFEFDKALDGKYIPPMQQAKYNQHLVDDVDSGVLQRATEGDKYEKPHKVMDFTHDYKGMVDAFEAGKIVFVHNRETIEYKDAAHYKYAGWFKAGDFEIKDVKTGETLHSMSQWERRGRVFAYSSDGKTKLTTTQILEREEQMKEVRTVIIPLDILITDSVIETLDSALKAGGHEIVGGENAAELKIKRSKEAKELTDGLKEIREKLYLEKTTINGHEFNGRKLAIYRDDEANVERVIYIPTEDTVGAGGGDDKERKEHVEVLDYNPIENAWSRSQTIEKDISENKDYVRYGKKDIIDRAMTYINLNADFAVESGYSETNGPQYEIVPEIELAGREPVEIFAKGTDTVIEINSRYALEQAKADLKAIRKKAESEGVSYIQKISANSGESFGAGRVPVQPDEYQEGLKGWGVEHIGAVAKAFKGPEDLPKPEEVFKAKDGAIHRKGEPIRDNDGHITGYKPGNLIEYGVRAAEMHLYLEKVKERNLRAVLYGMQKDYVIRHDLETGETRVFNGAKMYEEFRDKPEGGILYRDPVTNSYIWNDRGNRYLVTLVAGLDRIEKDITKIEKRLAVTKEM